MAKYEPKAPNLKVHLLDEIEPDELALLKSQLDPNIVLTTGLELTLPADFEILVAGHPKREHLAASPELSTLVIPWAGVPHATLQLTADFPKVTVHNLHHNAAPTAELALGLLFAAAKFILPFDQALRIGDWRPRYAPSPAVLLAGKQTLILGLGEIGQRIAKACLALDMEVFALKRHPDQLPPGLEQIHVHPPDALHQLLPRCQIMLIALPLTAQTRGLIGASELELMPDGSLLVNIARGPVVDQEALYRALVRGKLSAAGLDVWYNYPETTEQRLYTLPSNVPLYDLPNVVLSPHRGGASRETETLRMQYLARLINAAGRGQPIPNPVDVQLGY
jgi:phosphoglycerate dehydrogenase-like enzyme